MSNAIGARNRDMLARRMNRGYGSEMGIEISFLAEIAGDANRADLGQPQLTERIDHAGVDVQPVGVDYLRSVGDRQVAPDTSDAAVLDHDRAALDCLTRQRVDGSSADRISSRLPLRVRRIREDQQPEQKAHGPRNPSKAVRSKPESHLHGPSSPVAKSPVCFFGLAAGFWLFSSASFSLARSAFFSSAIAFRRFRSCS